MSTFASSFVRLRRLGCLIFAGLAVPLHAQSLQSILADALVNDPQLLEAKANEIGAHNAMKATRAGHYPVLSMVGNQMIAREDQGAADARRFNPGLRGTLNIYSWGGISAAVKRDKEKERYFHHKYDETREELGNTIGQLYLEAIRAQESLRVFEQNLKRHDKIIHDLEIIVKHDAGRRSELTQAKSRRLQVESNMAQVRRSMDLALSRLSRYTTQQVQESGLKAPFTDLTPEEIVSRYRNPDLTSTPSYQAQEAELQSARANVKVSKAARLPALNLEGQATRDNKEVYLNFSWNIFDQAAKYSVAQNAQTMIAAESRLNQMLREVTEKSRTAETDMQQSNRRAALTKAQIAAQQQVVKAYELQFKIARRSLIDVLDSYNELSGVEMTHVTAQNDYRDAALSYLRAQAQIFNWASSLTAAGGKEQVKATATVPLADAADQADTVSIQDVKAKEKAARAAPVQPAAPAVSAVKRAAAPAAAAIEPFVFTETQFQAASVQAEKPQTVPVAEAKPARTAVAVPVETKAAPQTAADQAVMPPADTAAKADKILAPAQAAPAAVVAVPMAETPLQAKASKRAAASVVKPAALPGEVPLQPVAAAKDLLSEPQPLLPKSTAPGEQRLVPTNAPADSLDLYINDLIKQKPAKQKPSRKSAAEGDSLDQYINNFLQTPRKS
ncbi:outer membrane protein TolC [Neisseria sp. HSC-16F19]|nr:TolC family protein [Neisseria sp. HSC-16F19]MCP2040404.1 outer membrane protein TolC [Neisseria sp. HSC-16F19]